MEKIIMWYRKAILINDDQLMSELRNNATNSDDIKSNYRMLARQYHPDVNQDPDSTENFKNLTRVYEEIKDQPVIFKPQQTGEIKTTAEEVKDELSQLSGSYVPKAIKDALGFLVSTYFVRNVPEEYDTPDYTVDDEIVNEIYDHLKDNKISPENIADLVNIYCGKYIRENY
jgi:curved DNA-binding protein CbpA